MCKLNVNDLVKMANALAEQSAKSESTSSKVADQMRIVAKQLREYADMLDRLATNLSNGLSINEPAGRDTVVLKEGERHPKAKKPGRKPGKKHKRGIPDSELTPEQLAARNKRRDICKMMVERKKAKALQDKFAETKIS